MIWFIVIPFLFVLFTGYGFSHLILSYLNSDTRQEKKARELTKMLVSAASEDDGFDKYLNAIGDIRDGFPQELSHALIIAQLAIYQGEDFALQPPPPQANSIEGARYRDKLSKRPSGHDAGLVMRAVTANLKTMLPKLEPGFPISVTLRDIVKPADLEGIVLPIYNHTAFANLREQLLRNIYRVSGVDYNAKNFGTSKLILPRDYKGTTPLDYIKDTPFYLLFDEKVDFSIPYERFFEHTHIVGGSGAGKTQLIQSLYLELAKTDASIVVVDSQTDLIRKISHLAGKDPIIISPKDLPSFNIFDVPNRSDDPHTKEQIANGVIETYMYVFDGIIGADLTAKQGVFFKMVARLLLNIKDTLGRPATIMDMFRLMEDMTPYLPAINALAEIPRTFFLKDFQQSTFKQTREQIRYRLNAILENPTIAKLFTAEHNSLDFYKLLQDGNIILIDTGGDFLKESSPHFGRFFISLVLRAIYERAASTTRHPTFLIIDEASQYFDSNIDDMLSSIRKYRCGAILAHQFLDQATPQLRASFAANTSVKIVSGVSSGDARNLAPDMRTTHEFILAQPKLTFACHVRGMKNAVSLHVEPGKLESLPQRDDYNEMLERNRARVSPRPQPVREAAQEKEEEGQIAPDGDPLAPVDNW